MRAFGNFCRRQKLKDYWDERTSYECPLCIKSITLRHYDVTPYKSFCKEFYRVDDLDLFFESGMKCGCILVKHRLNESARYTFRNRNEFIWR